MSNAKFKNLVMIAFSILTIMGAFILILWRSTEASQGKLPVITPISRETGTADRLIREKPYRSLTETHHLSEIHAPSHEALSPIVKEKNQPQSPVQNESYAFDPEEQPRDFFAKDFSISSDPIEGLILFYQDTTLGEGYPADVNEDFEEDDE